MDHINGDYFAPPYVQHKRSNFDQMMNRNWIPQFVVESYEPRNFCYQIERVTEDQSRDGKMPRIKTTKEGSGQWPDICGPMGNEECQFKDADGSVYCCVPDNNGYGPSTDQKQFCQQYLMTDPNSDGQFLAPDMWSRCYTKGIEGNYKPTLVFMPNSPWSKGSSNIDSAGICLPNQDDEYNGSTVCSGPHGCKSEYWMTNIDMSKPTHNVAQKNRQLIDQARDLGGFVCDSTDSCQLKEY